MQPGLNWNTQKDSIFHPLIIFGNESKMDHWKIQLVVVTFCALVQTYRGLVCSAEQERGLPNEWHSESLRLNYPMEDLMKRSKALRFYGLMGKRAGRSAFFIYFYFFLCYKITKCLFFCHAVTKKPFQFNRRNKGEMFVGLMGRSLSSGESLIRDAPSEASTEIRVAEKPYSKGMIQ
ncbi:uncharacterized protein LOC112154479 isoform X1 [Oryzias melastigma]|uniref:uncharacterized protein LOC112154479 isoform X1 n=1 Tax=Oryzias melastigma TaxID=30732 RepID=UPI00168D53FE|nr:uncharacterized protein LOC112154479 isoform X1 [Oryzias melastigma]